MTLWANPTDTLEATAWFATGLVGVLGVRILDGATEVIARTTSGIVENPAASGHYTASIPLPSLSEGHYTIFWDDGDLPSGKSEDLYVVGELGITVTPSASDWDKLRIFTDYNTEPVLTLTDLYVLLSMTRMPDQWGTTPDQVTWEPTYDIWRAVANGWLLKASRVASRYMFMSGGKMFSRQQYYDHCMTLYKKYINKSPLKANRLGAYRTYGVVVNNASD